jgi:hypothetical protein
MRAQKDKGEVRNTIKVVATNNTKGQGVRERKGAARGEAALRWLLHDAQCACIQQKQ